MRIQIKNIRIGKDIVDERIKIKCIKCEKIKKLKVDRLKKLLFNNNLSNICDCKKVKVDEQIKNYIIENITDDTVNFKCIR